MSLYRIILVDDEEEIREAVKKRVDWEGCGFELVASVENGQEAMEKCEALNPDVVITDIKMPFVDGLNLGKWLYEQMPDVKLVVFSGFDDFEYAQKAIQINVTEYLLKPLKADELMCVLKKLKLQIDKELEEKRNLSVLREHYNETLPILREQFLNNLIDGRILKEQINLYAERYDLDLGGRFKTVALAGANIEGSGGVLSEASELIPLSVKKLIDGHLPRFCRFISFVYGDMVAVIAMMDNKAKVNSLVEGLNHICKTAMRFLEIELSVGIGPLCDTDNLKYAAAGARSALDYRLILGQGKALYLDDIEPRHSIRLTIDEQDKRDLALAIKIGSKEDMREWIDRFITSSGAVVQPIAEYRLFLLEMLSELLNIIRSYRLDVIEIFGSDFDGSLSLSNFTSQVQLGDWFLEICQKISAMIKQERKTFTKSLAENAKQFIIENYSNPGVSVELLCEHLHVSPTYFSTLFKKETGLSFVAYLTKIRLEEAVRLLDTTQDKTYEIADKVGYSEPSYFSYVFRKQFGVSPGKYRSSQEVKA